MTDTQTIKERLILFIETKNTSAYAFEKACGLSQGFVKNIRVNISPDKLVKITNIYSDLNTNWLITGEGEMLKRRAVDPAPPYEDLNERLKQLQEERDELKQQNADQASLIKTLQKAMELMQDTIDRTQGKK